MANRENERDLNGKVVVITGASSGFGRGAALELAKAGASLVLAARRGALLEELARECEAHGVRAIAVQCDVSRAEDVAELAQRARAEFKRIDTWINDAGIAAIGKFQDVPLEDHTQVISTNLLGVLYGSWHAYKQFLVQGHGTLINIASELGRVTVPYYASYAAAKHGVVGMSESLRQEIAMAEHENIHVCTVLPTAHDTPFFDHAAHYSGHAAEAPRPLHDPQDVVDALVSLVRNPKDQTIVGGDGLVKIAMKKLLPSVSEAMGAKQMHKVQMEEAAPAADSAGALHHPMGTRAVVDAGRREQESR
jgi:short-subunit dehydrogenase